MVTVMIPQATRRSGIPSRPIVLSDGLEWEFSLPSRLIRPRIVESLDPLGRRVHRVTVEIGFGYPMVIRRLIDGLNTSRDRGSVAEQYESFLSLASALLMRSHDIDVSTACRLLTFPEADFPLLVNQILQIIKFDVEDFVEE